MHYVYNWILQSLEFICTKSCKPKWYQPINWSGVEEELVDKSIQDTCLVTWCRLGRTWIRCIKSCLTSLVDGTSSTHSNRIGFKESVSPTCQICWPTNISNNQSTALWRLFRSRFFVEVVLCQAVPLGHSRGEDGFRHLPGTSDKKYERVG